MCVRNGISNSKGPNISNDLNLQPNSSCGKEKLCSFIVCQFEFPKITFAPFLCPLLLQNTQAHIRIKLWISIEPLSLQSNPFHPFQFTNGRLVTVNFLELFIFYLKDSFHWLINQLIINYLTVMWADREVIHHELVPFYICLS